MICTANYIARKFGVRAAMPGFIARRLCPDLVLVKANHEKYASVSNTIRKILQEYDANPIYASLDEAYLHVTSYFNTGNVCNSESKHALAAEIRRRIKEVTGGLTSSAGIGPSRILAKICSDVNKPDGQKLIDVTDVDDFLSQLPVRKIPGIGKCRERELATLGIKTCDDLWHQAPTLSVLYSKKTSEFLLRASMGLDPHSSDNLSPEGPKSISSENTITPTDSYERIEEVITDLSERVARQLQSKKLRTGQLTVKVKNTDYLIHSYCESKWSLTDCAEVIKTRAMRLLGRLLTTQVAENGRDDSDEISLPPTPSPRASPDEIAPADALQPDSSDILVSRFTEKIRLIGIRCGNLTSTQGCPFVHSNRGVSASTNPVLSDGNPHGQVNDAVRNPVLGKTVDYTCPACHRSGFLSEQQVSQHLDYCCLPEKKRAREGDTHQTKVVTKKRTKKSEQALKGTLDTWIGSVSAGSA
eukprot:Filipodium_phascolosomae@DN2006_c0_g1_i4.p1